jgi:hypothetical protein
MGKSMKESPAAANAKKPRTRTRQEVMDDVCAHLENGLSLNTACKAVFDAPHPTNILAWKDGNPDTFGEQYARARETGYKLMADKLIEIADEPIPTTDSGSTDAGAVAHQRLRLDTRKWMLAKMLPKLYGDRIETVHSGSMEITQPIDKVRLELATLLKNAK